MVSSVSAGCIESGSSGVSFTAVGLDDELLRGQQAKDRPCLAIVAEIDAEVHHWVIMAVMGALDFSNRDVRRDHSKVGQKVAEVFL